MTMMQEIDQELIDFFEVKKLELEVSKDVYASRHVVLCTDPEGLLDFILYERQVPESDFEVKIGIDGGGSFLKVCLSCSCTSQFSGSRA